MGFLSKKLLLSILEALRVAGVSFVPWQILGSSKQIKNECKKQANDYTANDWEIKS